MAETPQNLGDSGKSSSPNPPIMKVDAPTDDPKQETDDNKQNAAEEFRMCSPTPRVSCPASNPFASHNKPSTRGILKPPQLSVPSSPAKPSFVLNPSRLAPLTKSASDSAKDDKKAGQANGETPKFVPLIQSDTKSSHSQPSVTSSSSTAASASSFVFGQNLQERVIAAAENKSEEPKPSTSLNSNGTSEMLFSSAIKNDVKTDVNVATKETKTLSESAREYEESRASKRKYEEVEVLTGEEGENNILNVTCKLFAFDKASGNWQERGRGVLRLNDLEGGEHAQSRLVFRTTGSLRVVLNTKIWAEMTVEQASEKSVRFTALDANGVIKVFLAMAGIDDSKQLYAQIRERVQKEIVSQKHKKPSLDTDSGSK